MTAHPSIRERQDTERRQRTFSENAEWARWGRFDTELPDGVTLCHCGVCGEAYEFALAKAEHLEKAHGAIVRVVADGSMYEWRR